MQEIINIVVAFSMNFLLICWGLKHYGEFRMSTYARKKDEEMRRL
jgi:hypothetical protein